MSHNFKHLNNLPAIQRLLGFHSLVLALPVQERVFWQESDCDMLGMSLPLPTSSSLILSSCSEWTAIAWKGSWWATVLSQGRTCRRYLGCANQVWELRMLRPQPTLLGLPLRAPPCQLSPFDVILDWAQSWSCEYSFKYKLSARSIVPGCSIRQCFPFRHPFVCLFRGLWAVCRGHQPWWRRQGRSSRDHQRKRECPSVF